MSSDLVYGFFFFLIKKSHFILENQSHNFFLASCFTATLTITQVLKFVLKYCHDWSSIKNDTDEKRFTILSRTRTCWEHYIRPYLKPEKKNQEKLRELHVFLDLARRIKKTMI